MRYPSPNQHGIERHFITSSNLLCRKLIACHDPAAPPSPARPSFPSTSTRFCRLVGHCQHLPSKRENTRGRQKHLLSQTPALRAMTPTSVSGSFLSNCRKLDSINDQQASLASHTLPSCSFATTIERPIISQMWIGRSRNTDPTPLFPT
jgi:hypothetical protein